VKKGGFITAVRTIKIAARARKATQKKILRRRSGFVRHLMKRGYGVWLAVCLLVSHVNPQRLAKEYLHGLAMDGVAHSSEDEDEETDEGDGASLFA
jgi:hypothetical protein